MENQLRKSSAFDVAAIRKEFPILEQQVNGLPLVYLDNAATTQKPQSVIDAIEDYYRYSNANVHRAAHSLSNRATQMFETARQTLAEFINSPSSHEIIWVRGATEAINLVAATWGKSNITRGDKIIVTRMEHHSNIVPWQLLAESSGAQLLVAPVTEDGELDCEGFSALLDKTVKLVALNHVSNALGTINPIEQMIAKAHAVGAKVLIDGAQAVAHWSVDVQALDCDFYVFSSHKMFGPTGIGVLWGREQLLEAMPPYQCGGEMIERVSFDGTSFNTLPYKFEAGTPNIAGAIGMAKAVEYLNTLDRCAALEYEQSLLDYVLYKAQRCEGVKRIGAPAHSASIFSFNLEGIHPEDVGTLLDQQGVAVRTGHHCAQPLMERLGIVGTVRASFSIYNTFAEVDSLFAAIDKARKLLQ